MTNQRMKEGVLQLTPNTKERKFKGIKSEENVMNNFMPTKLKN